MPQSRIVVIKDSKVEKLTACMPSEGLPSGLGGALAFDEHAWTKKMADSL